MKEQPKAPTNLIDHGFMEARAKLLDIAAFLDRLDRFNTEDDFRVTALREAVGLLHQADGDRTRAVLNHLSDPSSEPIPEAHTKGAAGAYEGETA